MVRMTEKVGPTPAQPSAELLGWGAFLSIVGWPLVVTAAYLGLRADSHSMTAPTLLMVAAWLFVVAGAVCLAAGVYRVAQHADRTAGIRYRQWDTGAKKAVPAAPTGGSGS